jgi:hypothetical protein
MHHINKNITKTTCNIIAILQPRLVVVVLVGSYVLQVPACSTVPVFESLYWSTCRLMPQSYLTLIVAKPLVPKDVPHEFLMR